MARLQTLPYIDIQHDALAVFDDVAQGIVEQEDVWVSCYKLGESSVHGRIKLTQGDSNDGIQSVRMQERDGVKVVRRSHATFTAEAPSLRIKPTIIRFPRQTLQPPSNKSNLSAPLNLNVVDLSPSSSQVAYGGPDGYVRVHSTSNDKSPPLCLTGHVGDVLAAKWFPSGSVLLSSSSDSTIRIHSTESGSSPRILTGHKRAVTALHIIGVGKNVLSGSKDGSVKLWNVGEGKSLTSMWIDGFKGVGAMVVAKVAKQLQEGQRKAQEAAGETPQEFDANTMPGEIAADTEGQAVFVGTLSGTISIIDLASKKTIYASIPHLPPASGLHPSFPSTSFEGAIQAIAFEPSHGLLATGSSKGVIVIRSVHNLHDPDNILCAFRRTEGAINGLAFVAGGEAGGAELAIADDSGLPCKVRIRLPSPSASGEGEAREIEGITGEGGCLVQVVEEYAGWEAVPVESVAAGPEGLLWFAGSEAGLRRY